MKEYSLGFLINDKRSPMVWLIRKNKPKWQKGLLNGIGGKREPTDLSFYQTMVREFKEEAGLNIPNWEQFCILTDEENYQCHCFVSYSNEIPVNMTDEKLECHYVECLYNLNTIPNVPWLVSMAMSFDSKKMKSYYVKECYAY